MRPQDAPHISVYYLLVSTLIVTGGIAFLLGYNVRLPDSSEAAVLLTFAQNMPNAIARRSLPLGHFWSLAAEIQLYILLPWLVAAKRAILLLYFGIALSVMVRIILIVRTAECLRIFCNRQQGR